MIVPGSPEIDQACRPSDRVTGVSVWPFSLAVQPPSACSASTSTRPLAAPATCTEAATSCEQAVLGPVGAVPLHLYASAIASPLASCSMTRPTVPLTCQYSEPPALLEVPRACSVSPEVALSARSMPTGTDEDAQT